MGLLRVASLDSYPVVNYSKDCYKVVVVAQYICSEGVNVCVVCMRESGHVCSQEI